MGGQVHQQREVRSRLNQGNMDINEPIAKQSSGIAMLGHMGKYLVADHPVQLYRQQYSGPAPLNSVPPLTLRPRRSAHPRPPMDAREKYRHTLKHRAKLCKRKPHRQHYYQALKRLYKDRYVGDNGQRQKRWDQLWVKSINMFDQFTPGVSFGRLVVAVLILQILMWTTFGFMAGQYGATQLAKDMNKLPGEVLVKEVTSNARLSTHTGTDPAELWRWIKKSDWRKFDAQYLVDWGALYLPKVTGLGFMRWFTSLILHHSSIHLLVNTALLFWLGSFLEYRYGPGCLLLLMCACGLAGNIMFAVFGQGCRVSVGFSGCIFGLVGLNMNEIVINKENNSKWYFKILAVIEVVALFVLQLVFTHQVNHVSHVAGFLEGVLLSALLLPTTSWEYVDLATPWVVGLVQIIIFFIFPLVIYTNVVPSAKDNPECTLT